jgi:predicted enzyme related to lactoylglutathione lyase
MANPFTYVELHTTAPEQAKDFYRRLFDWKLSDMKVGPGVYTEIHAGEGLEAGLMGTPGKESSYWTTYVRVDDVQSATKRAKELGGTALQENVEIPNTGRFSLVRDPTGAVFGLFQKLA